MYVPCLNSVCDMVDTPSSAVGPPEPEPCSVKGRVRTHT